MREAVVGARADDVARQLTPNPLVVIDSDGIVRSINPSASRLLPLAAVGSRMTHQASWLAEAHDRCTREQGATVSPHLEVAAGPIGDRRYHAHPAIIGIGDVAWSLVEDTGLEARDFEQALGLERQRSAILSEASSSLTAMLNIDRCRSAVASLAARHLADAAIVVARVGLARRLQLVGCESGSSAGVRSADADARTVPGLCEALDGLPVSSAAWLDPSLLPDWLVPPGLNSPVSSVVIAALPGPGQPAGALVLLRAAGRPAFSADEERFAHVFAARAGAALTAARLYSEQAAVTRTLMHDLLPPQLHRIHGIEYAGGYRAAGDLDVVGGDFYNVHPGSTPQDDTLVVLGDVCGKGLEAAVLSGKIRTTVQALRSLSGEHHTILSLLNESLLSAENTRFATMVLASVHSENDAAVLRLTSAGHLPPLLVRGDGRVHPADTEGTVIGVLPDIKTATYSTSLAPGEACVLYTDGVTEARGGLSGRELFGEQRLATCLRECNGMPAEAIVERVMMQAAGWAGSRTRDDMAVVVITSPQRTHLSAVDGRTRGRYIA